MATFTGSTGDDTYPGTVGVNDTAVIAATSVQSTFAFNGANWIISGTAGVDTLVSIEQAQFSDGTIGLTGGSELAVNSFTTGAQSESDVARLTGGGYVTIWQSAAQDGSGQGIYSQLFDANGARVGVETRVNTTTAGDQIASNVTSLTDGGYVVTWDDGVNHMMQRYAGTGAAVGSQTALTTNGYYPADVTYSTAGGFATLDVLGTNWTLFRFNADGVIAGSTNVAGNSFMRTAGQVTTLSNGSYVVTWQSAGGDGSGQGAFYQLFNSAGTALTTELIAPTNIAGDQLSPSITALTGGGFAIAWSGYNINTAQYGSVYVQRFNSSGGKIGTETLVSSLNQSVAPTVQAMSDGGYVVAWYAGTIVYAQRFAIDGSKVGAELRLSSDAAIVTVPDLGIVGTADGGYTVSWTSPDANGSGIVSQHVFADNSVELSRLIGDGAANTIVNSGNGMVFIDGGAGNDTLTGGGSDDIILGGTGTGIDTLNGGTGNDSLSGGDGNDTLIGGIGNDSLYGDGGNDTLDGGIGNNNLDGGAGSDTAVAAPGTVFSYNNGWTLTGTGSKDILTGIEQVQFAQGIVTLKGGTELIVNATTIGHQIAGEAVTLTGGGYVATWTSTIGSGFNIVSQRFDAAGNKLGGEVIANTVVTTGSGETTAIALSDGGYLVGWFNQATNQPFVQRYAADGSATGTPIVLAGATIGEIAPLAAGGFVRVTDVIAADYNVSVQRYNADGTVNGAAFNANTTLDGTQINSDVASYSDGRFIVVWQSYRASTGQYDVYLQRYSAAGVAQGGETLVNSFATDNQTDPAIATLTGGGFAVAWQSSLATAGGAGGAFVQRFDAAGAKLGAEIELGAGFGARVTTVQAMADGGFVVGWLTNSGVFAQRFTSVGAKNGDIVTLHSETPLGNELSIVPISGGGFTGIWGSSDGESGGVVSQKVFSNGGVDLTKLTGDVGNNIITYVGDNRLIIAGGLGNDTLTGGNGADRVDGEDGDDILRGGNGADAITGGIGKDTLYGEAGADILTGGTGDDILDGGTEADILNGEDGDDILRGGNGADVMTGGIGKDAIFGDSGNDVLNGGAGDDALDGGTEADIINGDAGIDQLVGGDGDDQLYGGADGDSLRGDAGNDILDGGTGKDWLFGGTGNDSFYIDNEQDQIREWADEGTDTVFTPNGYTITNINIENATLTGTASVNLTGSRLANVLTGNSGDNSINGGQGGDRMIGGLGDDSYIVDDIDDVVVEGVDGGTDTVISQVNHILGANVETLRLIGTAISGTGNSGANLIFGNATGNSLDGMGGADRIYGGAGGDVYVARGGEQLIELLNEGTDTVETQTDWTLGDNFENLVLLGAANSNGTGNALSNFLIGSSGNNILDGGEGADTMDGESGNDTYIVDNIGDTVGDSGDGIDLVKSTVSFTLGLGLENLTLLDSADINGTGNGLANVIRGNGGANILAGGSGADMLYGGSGDDILISFDGLDRLAGGLGDDRYQVGGESDDIVELASQGTDTVIASITRSFTMSQNVENLVLIGGNVDGFGNALANDITGTAGANLLDGAGGADLLTGLGGNDVYLIDDVNDVVVEALGEGTDLIISSVTYTLGNNVEDLSLGGKGLISGFGNALDNRLTGNDNNNGLRGGFGSDTLVGGAGNDFLYGEDGDDLLTGGTGNDRLEGGIGVDTASYAAAMGGVVINLGVALQAASAAGTDTLVSIENIDGTNLYNDTLVGNALANRLRGAGGNDTLSGGAGNDILQGGEGNDTINADADDDQLDGGNGIDMLSYAAIEANVTIDLTRTSAQATGAGIDTIRNFENVEGSAIGNDRLIGNENANGLFGLGGDDILIGGEGADRLDGGADIDTVDYSIAYDGVIANLATGEATDDSGSIDTLVAIEYLIGSEFDDQLIGNAGVNRLTGGLGQDVLTGGGGNDVFVLRSAQESGTTLLTWDVIIDFAAGDKIDLSFVDGNSATLAIDDFTAFRASGQAFTAAGQLRFADGILYGNTDADTTAEFAIRVDGVASMSLTDFLF